MAKQKDPAWIKTLSDLAEDAIWSEAHSPAAIALRNMLKRQKGFSNITMWAIIANVPYDELGFSTDDTPRITEVIFKRGKQEWKFP